MTTKERLERAGWLNLFAFSVDIDVYAREEKRIFYNTTTDQAEHYYNVPPAEHIHSSVIDEFQLDLFCEKLT